MDEVADKVDGAGGSYPRGRQPDSHVRESFFFLSDNIKLLRLWLIFSSKYSSLMCHIVNEDLWHMEFGETTGVVN